MLKAGAVSTSSKPEPKPFSHLTEEEFIDLQNQEGELLVAYKLTAVHFKPPRLFPSKAVPPPKKHEVEHHFYGMQNEYWSMNVMLMNTIVPRIYRDSGETIIVLNGYDDDQLKDYKYLEAAHVQKKAWCYRLAPKYWHEEYNEDRPWRDADIDDDDYDINDDLDEAMYVFRPMKKKDLDEPEVA